MVVMVAEHVNLLNIMELENREEGTLYGLCISPAFFAKRSAGCLEDPWGMKRAGPQEGMGKGVRAGFTKDSRFS